MNLTINRKNESEFYCEITDELDAITGICPKDDSNYWRHYIVEDKRTTGERGLAIRLPVGATGGIWIDSEGVITEILISSIPTFNIYPTDINELLKKFIGSKFENYQSKTECTSSKVWEILPYSYYTEEGVKEVEE